MFIVFPPLRWKYCILIDKANTPSFCREFIPRIVIYQSAAGHKFTKWIRNQSKNASKPLVKFLTELRISQSEDRDLDWFLNYLLISKFKFSVPCNNSLLSNKYFDITIQMLFASSKCYYFSLYFINASSVSYISGNVWYNYSG